MIRQRLYGRPDITGVCSFCRRCRAAQRPDRRYASARRWTSSDSQAAPSRAAEKPNGRDTPKFGLGGLAGLAGISQQSPSSPQGFGAPGGWGGGRPLKAPALGATPVVLHDEDILPHEQAARGSAPAKRATPPPPPPPPPQPAPPPRRVGAPVLGVGARGATFRQHSPRSLKALNPDQRADVWDAERGQTGQAGGEWGQLSRRGPAQTQDVGGFVSLRNSKATRYDAGSRAGNSRRPPSISEFSNDLMKPLSDSRLRNDNGTRQTRDNGSSDFLRRFEGMASTSQATKTRLSEPPKSNAESGSDDDFFSQFSSVMDGKADDEASKASPPTADWGWVDETKQAAKEETERRHEAEEMASDSSSMDIAALRAMPLPTDYDTVEERNPGKKDTKDKKKGHKGYERRRYEDDDEDQEFPDRTKNKRRVSRRSDEEDFGDDFGFEFDGEGEGRARARRQRKEEKRAQKAQREMERLDEEQARAARPTPILLPEFITVASLGDALGIKQDNFLGELQELGFEDIGLESVMTGETAALVAQEYGFEPTVDTGDRVDLVPRPPPEDPSVIPHRPPIVTIMGHVDHGKTTMLDWLRKSSIVSGEHGGITQHIGAFSVRMSSGQQITFLDTPGHAAFLSMRQRGANVTDIVILVVAADDSVMPQTLEALRHARAAKVPFIVAINKVDKPEANVEKVKTDLVNNGVEIEDIGGDVQVVCVSGKTGLGMADLEENIVLLSEMLDIRAEPDGMAEGWVVESSVKSTGRVATVLVKRGTIRKGDVVVAGTALAKVRIMFDENGAEVEEAPPGSAVEVLGWRDAPVAGDMVLQAPDEGVAGRAIRYREEMAAWEKTAAEVAEQEKHSREQALAAEAAEAAAEAAERGEEPEEADAEAAAPTGPTLINFTVKGDVLGSVEAVCGSIQEIGNHEVRPRVLRSGPGQITESDVDHAAATGSVLINFNNTIPSQIHRLASRAGVTILDHTVIYHLTDEVRRICSENLPPKVNIKVTGEAEALQIFSINIKGRKYKNIVGCRVRNGQLTKNALYRVLRNGKVIFKGKLETLKFHKKDVTEVKKGTDCGLSFEDWEDFEVGDQVQAYEEHEEKREL